MMGAGDRRLAMMGAVPHYRAPAAADRAFNAVVARCTRMGLSVWGSRVLRVRGRRSGEWCATPVNVLTVAGQRYLVAPRGETQWVRNLRAAGGGELLLGRRAEPFVAEEVVVVEDKVAILREYLHRWKFEVGRFFDGVSSTSPDEELRRIAPEHPVFAVEPQPSH